MDHRLFAADAGHDVVAEVGARRAKISNHAFKISDLDCESIPPARNLVGSIRHVLTTSGGRIRRAQNQTEISAREHREHRRRVHVLVESEMP